MTEMFIRIAEKKKEAGLTWDQIAARAHIRLGSWMTGAPLGKPNDKELRRLAPVLNTTYEYLKYGKE